MFDKVVLCNQGSSILNQVRSRTLSLEAGTVEVLLLGGDKIASNWNDIEVASGENGLSVSLTGKQISSYVISSFFSCLSELHVVARCKDTDKPSFDQCHGVLVAVNKQAIILAVSDENIVVNDKLFMTFDVEETNNVLTAKADFDGVITQGILEERLKKIGEDFSLGTASQKDYSDNVLEENGGGKLPTNDAIKTYVKDGALRIVKGGTANVGTEEGAESFTANQKDDTTFYLGLGAAADKGIVTTIPEDASDADVPTTRAVSNFVSDAIGISNLTVTVGGQTDTTFNANQSGNDVTLALGTAAKSTVASSVDASNKPNDLPTNSAVDAFVGKGTLTIHVDGTSADVVFSANEVTDSKKRVSFGNASQATTASSVSVTDATEQAKLPTNSAVHAFVGTGTLTISKTDADTTGSESFGANESANKTIGLGLGTAADANVCTEIHQENKQDTTPELDNAQLNSLVTLQQARQIADESTSSSKSVSPTNAANDKGVIVEKGAMVWLAVNFVGDVGICDFSTVAQNNRTPVWSDSPDNKSTVAYIAKLNDNAGDFYATARKIAAGHKFRTLNAMDVSGMADPSYGFALCLCIESKEQSSTTPTEP